MSFQKRNVAINPGGFNIQTPGSPTANRGPIHRSGSSGHSVSLPPGIRPSPVDGRPTTSTGTSSLDERLAGHGGLNLGTSLLLEENGTTDHAGILLKNYAAEGLVQGHIVHVMGVGEQWTRELPGCVGVEGGQDGGNPSKEKSSSEKMKIAWRYEALTSSGTTSRAPPSIVPGKSPASSSAAAISPTQPSAFCHIFDLTKKLAIDSSMRLEFLSAPSANQDQPPFRDTLRRLLRRLSTSDRQTIHRIVIPSLLSPALYPPHASQPGHVLQFLHGLRALLRRYSTRLTIMMSLPLALYPRSTGLVRWMELLSDGVLELTPFADVADNDSGLQAPSSAAPGKEEQPQGILQIHRLPVFHEKGGGGGGAVQLGDDLAFTISRRRFAIRPFNLPPVEGDNNAQSAGNEKQTNVDIDF